MKRLSRKYKKRIKSRITQTLCGLSLVIVMLVSCELAGLSTPISSVKGKIRLMASELGITSLFNEEEEEQNTASANESYLNGIKINEKEYVFEQGIENYNVNLPYDTEDLLKLEYVKANENQTVQGENEYIMEGSNKTISFVVTSEDKSSSTTYTLNIQREHSANLKMIELPGYYLSPEFDPETTHYTIPILENITRSKYFCSSL